ncbi:TniQ family protein [Cupriavidus basilensis]
MKTLAGADLGPLPYESTQSLLIRLGYLNAMSPADFRAAGIGVIASSAMPTLLSPRGRSRLRQLTGWQPDPREEWLFRQLAQARVLAPTFRLCAKCFTHGYHSYMFQISMVETCPIHNEQLQCSCPCCGAGLGPCHLTKTLFAKPYHCASCRRPLGLSPPTPSAYFELRSQQALIVRGFAPHWAWVKRIVAKRHVLPELFQADFGRALRGSQAGIQASVFCAIEPSLCMRAKVALTVLSWQFPVHHGEPLSKMQKQNRLTRVYRGTLRLLQRWILSRCQHSSLADCVGQHWTGARNLGNGNLDCRRFCREECAYMLLRYAVEHDYRDRSIHADVRKATPCSEFALVERSLQHCPMLPLRAIFLAMYAECYLRLQDRTMFSPSLEGIRTDAELILCTGRLGEAQWGFTAFACVPGMPIAPFRHTHATVDAKLFNAVRSLRAHSDQRS